MFLCRRLLPALLAWPALAAAQTPAPRDFAILAVNDIYRIEGVAGGAEGGLDRLATLRRELERDHPQLITLHAGDLLYPSLMSRRYRGGQMISTLNVLSGALSALGGAPLRLTSPPGLSMSDLPGGAAEACPNP